MSLSDARFGRMEILVQCKIHFSASGQGLEGGTLGKVLAYQG
jgi:hypothetical protein